MTTKTQPKPKAAPAETPLEKRFRVTIITHKETIKYEMTLGPDALLDHAIERARGRLILEGGYVGNGLDGFLKPTDSVLRWIPLHMIEQVEVCEIVD